MTPAVSQKYAFEKVEACGNDFVLMQDPLSTEEIAEICDRHHGVGADGVMVYTGLVEGEPHLDHYDPDGSHSLCLNGLRASLYRLHARGLINDHGTVHSEGLSSGYRIEAEVALWLPMPDFRSLTWRDGQNTLSGFFADVGNPHFVLVDTSTEACFLNLASTIRHDRTTFPLGTNVHRVWPEQGRWRIKSFERGVEDYTLACGSGMYAAAAILMGTRSLDEVHFQPDGKGTTMVRRHGDDLVLSGSCNMIASGVWFCC